MTPEIFHAHAEAGYNRIPVVREVLADLDTPLTVYIKLARGPYSFLFESVQGGEKWGRYSIIGLPAARRIRITGNEVVVEQGEQELERLRTPDPLAWLQAQRAAVRVAPAPHRLRFTGGLVGYFGYDTVRYIEPHLRAVPPDELGLPEILLMQCEDLAVFDNLRARLYLITHADPAETDALAHAEARLDELIQRLRVPTPALGRRMDTGASRPAVAETDFRSGFTQAKFEAAVDRIKEYILAGDCMQVVLSQRMCVPLQAAPLDVYRALRGLNPSPYLFFMDLGDHHVVGSSPEILTHLENGVVTVRPIAGTRPRGNSEAEDQALERELLADAKERAEHLMLIDLGRNDVGRIAETGSVRVTERMVIERYSHVMHIVSNVQGRLAPGRDAIDVLRATFPAGTLSGAPKIRAMEIIDELEPVKRGIYGGAIGYIGWDGNMDTAIAIRTAVIKDHVLHIQAGAGVVADSVPANEWQETLNKGRAVFRAVAVAEAGLE